MDIKSALEATQTTPRAMVKNKCILEAGRAKIFYLTLPPMLSLPVSTSCILCSSLFFPPHNSQFLFLCEYFQHLCAPISPHAHPGCSTLTTRSTKLSDTMGF